MTKRAALPVIITALLTGCGRNFPLPGHDINNVSAPPDITLRAGERKQAYWTGIELMPTPDPVLKSTDPDVVAIEYANGYKTAYLRALAPGTSRVYYYNGTGAHNRGFLVTVMPAK